MLYAEKSVLRYMFGFCRSGLKYSNRAVKHSMNSQV